ncbi:hypothetical protein TNCV_608641 [Trichonephila clavipes]|nr:hypothetical protein TNCV_608641 [Trichonephila clavipes]
MMWGRGRLVAKVTDSWSACHDFEPSAAEDPPCLERCINLSRSQMSSHWYDVVVRREGCQLKCHPRHLNLVKNYEVCRKSLRVSEQCDANFPSLVRTNDKTFNTILSL